MKRLNPSLFGDNSLLNISNRKMQFLQEEIENKIEVADALAIKLLQRYNHSTSTMKTASQHLSGGNYQTQFKKYLEYQDYQFYSVCLKTHFPMHVQLNAILTMD